MTAKPKRFSDVLLEAKQDLPLLVETHYGLGKTVGFLSDVKNRWAADWLGWPGYARLWAQVVRDSAQRDSGEGVRWKVARQGREAHIELTALGTGGSSRNALWPRVRVTPPGRSSSVVALRQSAPGRYRAQVPLGAAASIPWRFELLPVAGIDAAEAARAGSRALFYSYPDEDRLLPVNLPLLRTLSEQTGGALAPGPEEIFRPRGDGGLRTTSLWPRLQRASPCLRSCWTSWCAVCPGPAARRSERGYRRERVGELRALTMSGSSSGPRLDRALTLAAHRN